MNKYILLIALISNVIFGKTVSIIVPCHPKHAQHIESLLRVYEQQTVLPDEVVVSFSNAGSVDNVIQNISTQRMAIQSKNCNPSWWP